MRRIFAIIALSFAIPVFAQDAGAPTPPKELKNLSFLLGTFEADLKMFMPGAKEGTPLKGVITTTESLNGMFLESRHDSEMAGMKMSALQMTSYDPDKKKYMAFWFDSFGPGGIELWGKLDGQTIVLESKPIEVPGMPGKHAYRWTTSMKGAGKLLQRVEMNSGKGWSTIIEGTLTKK